MMRRTKSIRSSFQANVSKILINPTANICDSSSRHTPAFTCYMNLKYCYSKVEEQGPEDIKIQRGQQGGVFTQMCL